MKRKDKKSPFKLLSVLDDDGNDLFRITIFIVRLSA